LIEGTIFGECDMIFNRLTTHDYTAMCDCFLLRLPKALLRVLLEEFDDFREELFFIAKEREKENLKNIKTVNEGGAVPEQNSSHMEI
jgi:CRP-like cAMP-binding protein